jgi:hypothetical protein
MLSILQNSDWADEGWRNSKKLEPAKGTFFWSEKNGNSSSLCRCVNFFVLLPELLFCRSLSVWILPVFEKKKRCGCKIGCCIHWRGRGLCSSNICCYSVSTLLLCWFKLWSALVQMGVPWQLQLRMRLRFWNVFGTPTAAPNTNNEPYRFANFNSIRWRWRLAQTWVAISYCLSYP